MATKSNHKIFLKVLIFSLVALLVCLSYIFLQVLLNQDIYPGEIFQRDYTATNMYHFNEVRGRLERLIRSGEEVFHQEAGVTYYYNDGVTTYTNASDTSLAHFQSLSRHFYGYVDERFITPSSKIPASSYLLALPGQSYMLSFSDDFVAGLQANWRSVRQTTFRLIVGITIALLASILLFVRLIYILGNRQTSYLRQLDWIPLEVLLIGLIATVLFMSYIVFSSLQPVYFDDLLSVLTTLGFVYLSAAGFQLIVLLIVSRLKREQLADTSLIKKVFDAIGIVFNNLTSSSQRLTDIVSRRTILFLILLAGVLFLGYDLRYWSQGVILLGLFGLGLVTWFIRANNRTLSSIDQSMDRSVQEMLKSERTKVELITNVSHDLKTPLTSIISYVDLLKHEPLSPAGQEYVEVIANKSHRLNQILQDVFDLSKATTGDIKAEMRELDLRKLIEQTVFDMEAQIEASGHPLVVHLPEYAVMIESDGARLYRVLQNIIDNALKYTHPGTRIFLDLTTEGTTACMILKNTSAYAMDFTSENVLQRFYRADKARTSEGSGLGLSIAESFTELSGGQFDVRIEGDLFKVILTFPLSIVKGFS